MKIHHHNVLQQSVSAHNGNWIVVDVETSTTHWKNKMPQEYFEMMNASGFVEECLSYLPNPIHQAKLDIPRMHVCINGQKVHSVNELLHKVACHQVHIVAALCTQVVFGVPYERACKWAPVDMVVCERNPSARAYIALTSSDTAPPYTITSVYAHKRMQVTHPEDMLQKSVKLGIKLDIDISQWTYAVLSIHHS